MHAQDRPRIRSGVPTRLAAAAAAVALGVGTAHADLCSDCPAPTLADLAAQPGFALEERGPFRDTYEVDAGECEVTVGEPTEPVKEVGWLVLVAAGETMNCPEVKSCDKVIAQTSESATKEWSITTESGVSGTVLGLGLTAKLVEQVRETLRIETVTRIEKEICPAYCHRIAWGAYFEIARYTSTVDYAVTRRHAWWTKNMATGDRVHRKGDVWMACGSGTATLEAEAPIAGHFHLTARACASDLCRLVPTVDLGYFPPLPPAPTAPPEAGEGVGREEEPADDDEPTRPLPSAEEMGDPPTGSLPDAPGFEDAADDRDGGAR